MYANKQGPKASFATQSVFLFRTVLGNQTLISVPAGNNQKYLSYHFQQAKTDIWRLENQKAQRHDDVLYDKHIIFVIQLSSFKEKKKRILWLETRQEEGSC